MLEVSTSARPRKETVQLIFDHYAAEENPVSWSKAKRIADSIHRGTFKPNSALARAIGYSDRCGENAVRNVMQEGNDHYMPRYF